MAVKTKCQTPGTNFTTNICDVPGIPYTLIAISLRLPMMLNMTEEQAGLLEDNIHNALELVLAPYFKD